MGVKDITENLSISLSRGDWKQIHDALGGLGTMLVVSSFLKEIEDAEKEEETPGDGELWSDRQKFLKRIRKKIREELKESPPEFNSTEE